MSFPAVTSIANNGVGPLNLSGGLNSQHHTVFELKKFGSQGATFGAAYIFTTIATHLLLHPDAYLYNHLALYVLPRFVPGGLLTGSFAGLAMWVCWRLSGRRLRKTARTLIGTLMLIAGCYVADFWTGTSTQESEWLSVCWMIFFGILFGLFTGSAFNPLLELSRGTDRRSWIASTSGLVLRVLVLFLLMESILLLIGLRGLSFTTLDLIFILVAFGYCATSTFIVFSRLKLSVLCVLALIVNLPTASLLFPVGGAIFHFVIFGYLAVWAVFLLSRSALAHSMISNVLKKVST